MMMMMGGGPRNPEHDRKNRIRELRDLFKEKEVSAMRRNEKEGLRMVSPDTHELLPFLDKPVPKNLKEAFPAIEEYIVNTWLPMYPMGARIRKLQRDVAFRMKTRRLGKLAYKELLPILGELERKGLVKLRIGKKGRAIVILRPDADDEIEEQS